MEEAYVINLKSSKDRWLTIQKTFEGTGIHLNRIEPVKPTGKYTTKTRRSINSLSLTFLKLLKMAKSKNLPYLLVLEDDCKPAPDFVKNWPTIQSWLKSNLNEWDIYSGGSLNIIDPFVVGYKENITFYRPKSTWSSHFIYIHRNSYDAAIKKYRAAYGPKQDKIVATDSINSQLKLIISHPFVAHQNNSKSTITRKKSHGVISKFKKEERALGKYKTRKLFRKPT